MTLATRTGNSEIPAAQTRTAFLQDSGCADPAQGPSHDPQPARSCDGTPALLHVYDLMSTTKTLGLALYHVGVEVYSNEYSYSPDGITRCSPGGNWAHVHKEVIPLGRTSLSEPEFCLLVKDMMPEWSGKDYSLLGHNCQNFSLALVTRLEIDNSVVQKYCRISDLGAKHRGTAMERLISSVLASGCSRSFCNPSMNSASKSSCTGLKGKAGESLQAPRDAG